METSTMENQQPCTICNAVTTDKMVACDACNDWFHLGCVNEDETVFNREWLCRVCKPNPNEESIAASPAVGSQPATMKEISRLFEEIKACMEKCNAPQSSSSIDETCDACNQSSRGVMVKCDECARKIHLTCIENDETTHGRGWKCSKCASQPVPIQSSTIVTIMERLSAMERKIETNRSRVEPRAAYGFPHPCSTVYDHTHFTNEGELTRSQASARKVVSGKLPIFSGDPDEWDMFFASFEESTRLCGYSDGENMQRLREALKGHALKAVKRRLYYGDNLPEVLETLKTMYGRPELVIGTLLDKIRHAPLPKMEKLETLVEYGLEVEEICATVRKSGVENTYDGPLLEELVARLPAVLRLNWGMHCETLPSTTLAQFAQWMTKVRNGALRVSPRSTLREEKRVLKHVNVHSQNPTTTQPRQKVVVTSPAQAESSQGGSRKCACDEECNRLTECDAFLRMSAENRWKYVTEHHVCKCCLRRHQSQCRLQQSCGKVGCSKKHHTLLHSYHSEERAGKYETNNSHFSETVREVLLRYVPVTLRGPGQEVNVIALLDEGSSVSLMEHALAKKLGISGKPKPLSLSWTGGKQRDEPESIEVSINISGIGEQDRQFEVPAIRTVRNLGLPTQSLDMDQFGEKYQHLSQLPIPSFDAAAPRILLGMDNYHLTRPLKTVEGYIDEPVATKTRLGWVVSGRCDVNRHVPGRPEIISSHRARLRDCRDTEVRSDNALKGQLSPEEPRGVSHEVIRSKDDEQALELLSNKTKLTGGRYTTGLLWQYDDTVLPKGRSLALKKMECLEQKMNRDKNRRDVMNTKMKEGYVRLLNPVEKLSNYSQAWVLQRFRERRIVIAANISEMYHQVCINDEDLQSQRFLGKWSNEQAEPDDYITLRMTFGASFSPRCALYVKNVNRNRFRECITNHLTLEPSSTPNKVLGMWWGVLFTCLTVLAIHIKTVPSLSTSSCIIAIRNFIAHRGTPVEILSDRGTEFVGASSDLREALKEVNMNEMIEMALPDTKGSFNPPAAPYFGGAWQRLVQTVKQTLRNIEFMRQPTDAILNSWLIEVEHIVNARPLTDVPVDSEEDAPITPNHFLLGSSAGVKPFVTLDDSPDTIRNNWKTSQIYANMFWRKWVAAYLPTLTRRTRWYQPRQPLKEGDVVLIIDENLPRGCWPKGRIIRAIQSKDGAVRRVHVRLATGKTCERPAVKVAAIDIDQRGSVSTS